MGSGNLSQLENPPNQEILPNPPFSKEGANKEQELASPFLGGGVRGIFLDFLERKK